MTNKTMHEYNGYNFQKYGGSWIITNSHGTTISDGFKTLDECKGFITRMLDSRMQDVLKEFNTEQRKLLKRFTIYELDHLHHSISEILNNGYTEMISNAISQYFKNKGFKVAEKGIGYLIEMY